MTSEEERRPWLQVVTDLVVIAFLGVAIFQPSSPVMRWVRDKSEERALTAATAEAWQDLTGEADSQHPETILAFFDYECPACRQWHAVVADDPEMVGLEVEFRHLPLSAIHPHARDAALAAICADYQGVGASMHRLLFEVQPWQKEAAPFTETAQHAGVEDLDAFERCIGSDDARSRLEADLAAAARLQVRSTPTFVTPLGRLTGVLSPSDLRGLVYPQE